MYSSIYSFNVNNFLIMVIFIGIILIILDIKQYKLCKPNKVIYKYVPRTFEEEQEYPTYVSEILGNMFIESTPWIIGQTGNKIRSIN